MKNIIILMLISVSCFAQTRTTLTYEANDSIEFVSVLTFDRQKLPRLELKPNETREYHFIKGQNFFPVVVTAPSDPTKTYYIEYTLREEGVIIDPTPGTDPPTTETIDGFNMAYTGWSNNSVISDPTRTPGWHNNTISYSTTGEARYTFTGTGVELWGERLPSHGTGTVTVGTETKTVSWVGPKELPAKIVEFKGLQRGEHTIIVKPVSGYVLIDYLVVVK